MWEKEWWDEANGIKPKKKFKATYLLHFDKDAWSYSMNNYGDSRHYIGYSNDFARRVRKHLRGGGAVHTQNAVKVGCVIKVGALFVGVDRERELQKSDFRQYCKFCNIER